MKILTSFALNKDSQFLGLSVLDIITLGYLFITSHAALSFIGYELSSFLVVGFAFVALLAIRLKYRKKTIRDYFRYLLTRRLQK